MATPATPTAEPGEGPSAAAVEPGETRTPDKGGQHLPDPAKVRKGQAKAPLKIKPIKDKVDLPGVDTGFDAASPFDAKVAKALGKDPETGEGLDAADGPQFGEEGETALTPKDVKPAAAPSSVKGVTSPPRRQPPRRPAAPTAGSHPRPPQRETPPQPQMSPARAIRSPARGVRPPPSSPPRSRPRAPNQKELPSPSRRPSLSSARRPRGTRASRGCLRP